MTPTEMEAVIAELAFKSAACRLAAARERANDGGETAEMRDAQRAFDRAWKRWKRAEKQEARG